MDNQPQYHSKKKPVSGAPRKLDPFWEFIVPSARLEKGRLDPTTGAYPASHPRSNHVEELESTQPVVRKDKQIPHIIPTANVTDLSPHLGVTPKATKPVERRAKGGSEASTRAKPTDFYASVAEDFERTQAQPVICREKSRPGPTAKARSGLPYISLAEQLKRTQHIESVEHADDGKLTEGGILAPTSTLHKEDEDEELSGESEDTEGSDNDEEYYEIDNESASDVSSSATQRAQPYGTPRSASARLRGKGGKWQVKPRKATTSKRKTAPPQPAGATGRRLRIRVKYVFEESDEGFEENDEGEREEEAFQGSAPHNAHRPAKAYAQGKNFRIVPALPPSARRYQPWTKKEEWTLLHLRNQGKSWEYIGEHVLGRTASGARNHWDHMRTESLKPVKARAQSRRRRQKASVISAMAKIPRSNKSWSKEEERMLISLRAKGKTIDYISRRIKTKGYAACERRWGRIKGQYPQAVMASERRKSDKKANASDQPDSQPVVAGRHLGDGERMVVSVTLPVASISARVTQKLVTHRRSSSWPQ